MNGDVQMNLVRSNYRHADYLTNFLRRDKLNETVNHVVKVLEQYDFDGIAFCGMSGALIAPIVAFIMDKPLIVVRKPRDGSHSDYSVEGYAGVTRYIIVDDLVSTGKTGNRITKEVADFAPDAVCLGVLEAGRFMDFDGSLNEEYFALTVHGDPGYPLTNNRTAFAKSKTPKFKHDYPFGVINNNWEA